MQGFLFPMGKRPRIPQSHSLVSRRVLTCAKGQFRGAFPLEKENPCENPPRATSRFRREERAQTLTFWVRRPLGGVGVFHAKWWWPKSSCPPSKVCLSWVSKRGIWDVPGILPGCPGPLGGFKKFVPTSSCAYFVPYITEARLPPSR